ncbi:MAG: hypothetical protein HY898_10735 [Deltaproteobacteria bacterium]|nr:hypothetical protein [Deltaproteobacteria bacterium]
MHKQDHRPDAPQQHFDHHRLDAGNRLHRPPSLALTDPWRYDDRGGTMIAPPASTRFPLLVALALVASSCSSSNASDPPAGQAGAGPDGGVAGSDGSSDSANPDGKPCGVESCTKLGATCGKAPDGCGGVVSCGDCPSGSTCGGGGPNKCGIGSCKAKTCAELGASCGTVSDGCSATLDCGSCAANNPGASNVDSWSCDQGGCTIASCAAGHRDCDGASANGCESAETSWHCPLTKENFGDPGNCSAACSETAACSESCSTKTEYYRVSTGFNDQCDCAPGDPADCEKNLCFSGTCDYAGSTAAASPPPGAVHIGTGCSGPQEGADYYRLDVQTCTYTCPFNAECTGSPPKQCSRSVSCSSGPSC